MSLTKITVDVTQTDPAHRIKPLCGVNKGPIEAGRYDRTPPDGLHLDYSVLYRESGIQSVRTHGTVLDIANIFRGQSATWPDGSTEFMLGVAAKEKYLRAVHQLSGVTQADFQAAATDCMAGPFIFQMTNLDEEDPRFPKPQLGDCWLYWKPVSMADALDPNNYLWETNQNHAWDTYRAITNAGMEVYFRLGEGFHGPAYMGADDVDNQQGMALYAEVAGEAVAYLASQQDGSNPAVMPAFIEIVNEPDSAGFIGPLDQPFPSFVESTQQWETYDRVNLQRWCWEFQELYAHCVGALCSRDIPMSCIGSPGVTDHGARELVRYMRGGNLSVRSDDSKVYQLLHRLLDQDPASVNFAAFHWYGAFEDKNLDNPRTVAAKFPNEIRDTVSALKAVMAEFGVDRPIHVNEWNLTPLRIPDLFDVFDGTMTTPTGAAFLSFGLSVMQHVDLDIERAHLYPAFSPNNGLFHYEDGTFYVRPSAFAMKLHSGLVDDFWVPVQSQRWMWSDLGGWIWSSESADIFDAVDDGCAVVALASKESGAHAQPRNTVILTNLTGEQQEVTLEMSGLDPGVRSIRVKTIDADVLPASEEISESLVPWGSYVTPSAAQACTAYRTYSDIENNPDTVAGIPGNLYIDASRTCQLAFHVGPHGVMRIDLLGSYAAQSPGEWSGGLPESVAVRDDGSSSSGPAPASSFEQSAESEVSARSLSDLPGGKAENLRCYRKCLVRMRRQMEERGYTVDDELDMQFWMYFVARTEEFGRCPDELDVFDWYAWYRAHPV